MSAHIYDAIETQYIENRREQRLEVDETGTLCGVAVVVRNISRTGAQVACPLDIYATIESELGEETCEIELFLQAPIRFTAEVVYANASDEAAIVGVCFTAAENRDHELLDEYIRSL